MQDDRILGFSVLMSVYAKENASFFDLSLKSNLDDQELKPNEFVLVCDGPLTPELDNVIYKYEKEYPQVLKVIRCEKNQGLGKALNLGLDHCTYDLVFRADSDDISVPERFQIQFEFMKNHPEVSVCSSYIDEFENDWFSPISLKTLPLENDALIMMARFRNPINHMATVFRKKVIVEVGSYKHLPYAEDYYLWIRVICCGYKLANIDKVLVHARVGNGMIKRRGNRQYLSSWKTLSKYMMDNGLINRFQYFRNMISVRCFVYMPSAMKKMAYKLFLRKDTSV